MSEWSPFKRLFPYYVAVLTFIPLAGWLSANGCGLKSSVADHADIASPKASQVTAVTTSQPVNAGPGAVVVTTSTPTQQQGGVNLSWTEAAGAGGGIVLLICWLIYSDRQSKRDIEQMRMLLENQTAVVKMLLEMQTTLVYSAERFAELAAQPQKVNSDVSN